MSNYILTTKSLSVGYEKKILVSGLDINIRSGEILTIIGPNGSGKTTILKSIAAQLKVLSGNVLINNIDLGTLSLNAQSLSVCFTDRINSEKLTCEDIVSTGRYPYTGKLGILSAEDKRIIDESMDLTGTKHLADIDFRYISDGQRQNVMLARAIAQQPQILILDEPTSFLDINNKLKLLNLLKNLVRKKNIAVLQTLHELDLAQRFSDKILCIKDNKADKIGTPEEIFDGNYISELYGITSGSFSPIFATAEALPITGKPKVFVIGGDGNGIQVYRNLQRREIPFAAGVIHENDIEYEVAKRLSSNLVIEKAFEPISNSNINAALKIIESCNEIICCIKSFGTMNAGNKILLEKCKNKDIIVKEG